MDKKASIFFSLNDRACGYRNQTNLQRNALGSEFLIKRLLCERSFVGHNGCVNTVTWNDTGDILLSGSDDCKLNIYKMSSSQPVQSIQSGHQANIFSAKFLPCTGDTKIASCSGDGALYYNDVNNNLSYGTNPFRCHTGTTYEVNTTAGDPHTFMSSGEDGTIRLFDLRSKTKCSCDGCKEDVLIDCQKAVTSFSINPVQPYYVALGCENSLLKIYDRRSLSTGEYGSELGKQRGLLYQFKPKALEKRDCRVTSLKYSADGRNLLASYCSDYVYLLDSNPKQSEHLQSNMEDETDGTCPNEANDPPMKRLRLRGDWSDTGPNARPEGEEPGTSEDSFVQRMSGYLTRWIEESIRNARRQRRQNPTVSQRRAEGDTENHEGNTERNDDGNSSETLESTLPEQICDEHGTGTNSDSDVMESSDDVIDNSDDVINISNDVVQDVNDVTPNENKDDVIDNKDDVSDDKDDVTDNKDDVFDNENIGTNDDNDVTNNPTEVTSILPDVAIGSSRDFCSESREHDDDTKSASSDLQTNIDKQTRDQSVRDYRRRRRNNNSCGGRKAKENFIKCGENDKSCDEMSSRVGGIHGNVTNDGSHGDEMHDRKTYDGTKLQTGFSRVDREIDNGSKSPENKPPPVIGSQDLSPTRALASKEQNTKIGVAACNKTGIFGKSESRSVGSDTMDSGPCFQESQNGTSEKLDTDRVELTCELLSSDGDASNVMNERTEINKTGGEPSEIENSDDGTSRVKVPLSKNTRGRETPSTETEPSEPPADNLEGDVGESSVSSTDDSRRDAAASTIQNFFRFRVKKDFQSIRCDVPVHSDVKQVFKGHRNARTMIKEANFWGDQYVLSGSDCGRIFIWSRKTAEVVMLLEGDRHVVNCVQPHPYAPMLATSGIDYDIKLWTPTSPTISRLENAQEVISRNERMLRESRDTLTVPASFMIRVLSSLHRVRFHGEGGEHSSADSDSELEED